MSIQKDFTFNTGVLVEKCYFRIQAITLENNKVATIFVQAFKDTDKKTENIAISALQYILTGDTFLDFFSESVLKKPNKTLFTQGYVYLKTLSEYTGCEDI